MQSSRELKSNLPWAHLNSIASKCVQPANKKWKKKYWHETTFVIGALARSLKYIYALARNRKYAQACNPKWGMPGTQPHFALLRAVAGLFTFFISLIAQEIHRWKQQNYGRRFLRCHIVGLLFQKEIIWCLLLFLCH
jgi:hypothetical protein